jgi:hypothetical protein
MARPVIILHGYSDQPSSANSWCAVLEAHGYDAKEIQVGGYVSLSNEVTIRDVAEGFDRALVARLGPDQEFDAIVHSTGMLVIRAWLTSYGLKGAIGAKRQSRLKRLVGLAPATFGSPMAHKGRSWIGALVKGSKKVGHPDFLEAGDQVLSALELGSRYTWELTKLDLLGNVYTDDPSSPYPFILIGTKSYDGIRRVANEPGTDGTVRWAGCGFNTRKIELDLSVDPSVPSPGDASRAELVEWHNTHVPLAFVEGHDHGSIFTDPTRTPALVDAVVSALAVESAADYTAWATRHADWDDQRLPPGISAPYQQFLTRVVDERGDPVTDYFLELCEVRNGVAIPIEEFEQDVHSWKEDASFRCFHVDLRAVRNAGELLLRLAARSGTTLIGYGGWNGQKADDGRDADFTRNERTEDDLWNAMIRIPNSFTARDGRNVRVFYPFTTTLFEIRLNREPSFGRKGNVFWFEDTAIAASPGTTRT